MSTPNDNISAQTSQPASGVKKRWFKRRRPRAGVNTSDESMQGSEERVSESPESDGNQQSKKQRPSERFERDHDRKNQNQSDYQEVRRSDRPASQKREQDRDALRPERPVAPKGDQDWKNPEQRDNRSVRSSDHPVRPERDHSLDDAIERVSKAFTSGEMKGQAKIDFLRGLGVAVIYSYNTKYNSYNFPPSAGSFDRMIPALAYAINREEEFKRRIISGTIVITDEALGLVRDLGKGSDDARTPIVVEPIMQALTSFSGRVDSILNDIFASSYRPRNIRDAHVRSSTRSGTVLANTGAAPVTTGSPLAAEEKTEPGPAPNLLPESNESSAAILDTPHEIILQIAEQNLVSKEVAESVLENVLEDAEKKDAASEGDEPKGDAAEAGSEGIEVDGSGGETEGDKAGDDAGQTPEAKPTKRGRSASVSQ